MAQAKCTICGEPMPEGEGMFNYHGHSGPCPKPPLIGGHELPPLPEPAHKMLADRFTGEQMRAYGQACADAARRAAVEEFNGLIIMVLLKRTRNALAEILK